MKAKKLALLLELIKQQYFENCFYEAVLEEFLIVERQDELKKIKTDKVCKILKGLMREVKLYLSYFSQQFVHKEWWEIDDEQVVEHFQKRKENDLIGNFLKNMDFKYIEETKINK